MILHVEFGQFPDTVRRLIECKEVFVRTQAGTTVVTAGHPTKGVVVASAVRTSPDSLRAKLTEEGFEVFEGEWTNFGESAADRIGERQVYVAAVAYDSREKMPGLWVDAYPAVPVTATVLRNFYDELSENGEIGDVNFEEFVRLANPNVVIIGPNEIQEFLHAKDPC